jgi:hypothetical protein
MFLKLLKKALVTLKQVLHITQVLKFGETCLMIQKVIFGLSDVSYMKCVL